LTLTGGDALPLLLNYWAGKQSETGGGAPPLGRGSLFVCSFGRSVGRSGGDTQQQQQRATTSNNEQANEREEAKDEPRRNDEQTHGRKEGRRRRGRIYVKKKKKKAEGVWTRRKGEGTTVRRRVGMGLAASRGQTAHTKKREEA